VKAWRANKNVPKQTPDQTSITCDFNQHVPASQIVVIAREDSLITFRLLLREIPSGLVDRVRHASAKDARQKIVRRV
jgi:hypothetical protein